MKACHEAAQVYKRAAQNSCYGSFGGHFSEDLWRVLLRQFRRLFG